MKILQSILILSFTIGTLFGQEVTPIAKWSFDEMTGVGTQEEISGKNFLIFSNWAPPERKSGVGGMSLRLDGYSTWIEGSMEQELSEDSLSIAAWVAMESYPTGFGGVFVRFDASSKKGVWIGVNRWGYIEASANIGGILYALKTPNPIERMNWEHLALSIDPASERMSILLNGEEVVERAIPNEKIQYPTSKSIQIGTHFETDKIAVFNKNLINGLIDELTIWGKPIIEQEAKSIYDSNKPLDLPALNIPNTRFEDDSNRPIFHAMPDAAWTNEPHGLVYEPKTKTYHIFYQKNANGPYWSHINWGHLSSKDLIKWKEEDIILWPEPGFDQEGIWSGHTIIADDGTPTIMYTGVDGVKAGMGLAMSDSNMMTWEKYPGNPVVPKAPVTYATRDFRDPFIWKDGDMWRMVIGSGIASQGSGGALFIYESTDLIDWKYLRAFHIGRPEEDDAGIFWEMPVVIKYGEKYLVLVNKVPEPGRRAQALYWTGIIHNNRFIPDETVPFKMDIINGLLAPSLAKDAQGRDVAMGIIPDEVSAEKHYEQGWAHTYSLPRVWSLRGDSILVQKPLPELSSLRGQHTKKENLEIMAGQENFLPDVAGKHLELKATINPNGVREFGIYLRRSPDKSEQTKIYYDFNTQLFWVDRSRSSTSNQVPKGISTGKYEMPNDQPFDLHVFLDASVIEVFINGEAAFATRIFPEGSQSIGVDMYAKGGTAIVEALDVWQMNDMQTVNIKDKISKNNSTIQNAWPNPFEQEVNFTYTLSFPAKVSWRILDLFGREVYTWDEGQKVSGIHKTSWIGQNADGSRVASQIYIAQIIADGEVLDTVKVSLK